MAALRPQEQQNLEIFFRNITDRIPEEETKDYYEHIVLCEFLGGRMGYEEVFENIKNMFNHNFESIQSLICDLNPEFRRLLAPNRKMKFRLAYCQDLFILSLNVPDMTELYSTLVATSCNNFADCHLRGVQCFTWVNSRGVRRECRDNAELLEAIHAMRTSGLEEFKFTIVLQPQPDVIRVEFTIERFHDTFNLSASRLLEESCWEHCKSIIGAKAQTDMTHKQFRSKYGPCLDNKSFVEAINRMRAEGIAIRFEIFTNIPTEVPATSASYNSPRTQFDANESELLRSERLALESSFQRFEEEKAEYYKELNERQIAFESEMANRRKLIEDSEVEFSQKLERERDAFELERQKHDELIRVERENFLAEINVKNGEITRQKFKIEEQIERLRLDEERSLEKSKELHEKKALLDDLEFELNRQSQIMTAQLANLEVEKNSLAAKKREIEEERRQIDEERRHISQERSDIQREAYDLENKRQEYAAIFERQEQDARALEDSRLVEAQLKAEKLEDDLEDISGKLIMVKQANSALKEELESVKGANVEFEGLKADLIVANKKNEELQVKLMEFEKQLDDSQSLNAELVSEVESLRDRVKGLEGALDSIPPPVDRIGKVDEEFERNKRVRGIQCIECRELFHGPFFQDYNEITNTWCQNCADRQADRVIFKVSTLNHIREMQAKIAQPADQFRYALELVSHITFPPGDSCAGGAECQKTWLVRNVGIDKWPDNLMLYCVDNGEEEPMEIVNPIPALEPNEEGQISIMFTTEPTFEPQHHFYELQNDSIKINGRLENSYVLDEEFDAQFERA